MWKYQFFGSSQKEKESVIRRQWNENHDPRREKEIPFGRWFEQQRNYALYAYLDVAISASIFEKNCKLKQFALFVKFCVHIDEIYKLIFLFSEIMFPLSKIPIISLQM